MKKLILFTLIIFSSAVCLADTIYLKSGKTRQGRIIEKTKDYIKIDYYGMPITFFMDEIEKIEESESVSEPALESTSETETIEAPITPAIIERGPTEPRPEEAVLAGPIQTLEDFTLWLTHYHEDPTPANLVGAFKIVVANQDLLSEASRWRPMAHFFATALQSDKSRIDDFKTLSGEFYGVQRQFIEEVISNAENFKSPEVTNTIDLDFLWAEFLATGKEAPIEKIIEALVISEEEKGAAAILITKAARLMLAHNARQYPKIHDILKANSLTAKGELKKALEGILQELNKTREKEAVEID